MLPYSDGNGEGVVVANLRFGRGKAVIDSEEISESLLNADYLTRIRNLDLEAISSLIDILRSNLPEDARNLETQN